MNDHSSPSRDPRVPGDHEGWAELEAAESALARKDGPYAQNRRERLADPLVQRGAAIRAMELLDEQLGLVADEVAASIRSLAQRLTELDLIDEDNPGAVLMPDGAPEQWSIEVEHPEPRLYAWAGVGVDTIVATRMRDDGRYEHSTLDEYGAPIRWRTSIRPELN